MTSRQRALTMLALMLSALVLMVCAAPSSVFAEEDTVTRAEWMSALETAYEMGEDEIALFPEEYLSDANDPATREFAAATVNYFVGYELNQGLEYSFSDAADVTDKNSAEFAVNKGLLALKEGAFCPNDPITTAEKDSMLPAAKAAWTDQYGRIETEEYATVGGLTPEADGRGVRHTAYIPKKLGDKPVISVTCSRRLDPDRS